MKNLLYYCAYRMSKFYEDWGESNGHVAGGTVLFGCIGFNVLSIITICLYFLDKKLSIKLIGIVLIGFVIASMLFFNKNKYEKLCEKYKNESRRRLKGWLVFIYFLFSVLSYILIVNLLDISKNCLVLK